MIKVKLMPNRKIGLDDIEHRFKSPITNKYSISNIEEVDLDKHQQYKIAKQERKLIFDNEISADDNS